MMVRKNGERGIKFKINGYEKVIGIARKEIGLREEGCENCGSRIRDYLDYVGIKQAAPWCAAFVSYCFGKAGYPEPRTAWSPALFPKDKSPSLSQATFISVVGGRIKASMSSLEGSVLPKGARGKLVVPLTGLRPPLPRGARGEKGLVYGIYFANLKRIGHCGLVESVRNGWLTGIEGNTNLEGSREGEGVFRRIRHVRTIHRFADWIRE